MVVVVAIVEGADRQIFQQVASAGGAPWWAHNAALFPTIPIECGPAPYEPSNLASAFTGTGRGEHGCYSYWQVRGADGARPRVLTSADVRRPWVWHWPELRNLKKAVVNIQLTHPPEPLDGTLVSYLMAQTLRYTYPENLARDLARKGLRYGHDVSAFYRGEGPEWLVSRTRQIAEYQLETALHLGSEADILVVNLTLIDRLSHFLWPPAQEIAAGLSAGTPLFDAYSFIDGALARLDRLAGEDPMFVFTEIGFGPIDGFVSFDAVLQAAGLQQSDENGTVDESTSVARETVQGTHGITLLGDARGSRNALDEVRHALAAARDGAGSPLISKVWEAPEIYEGDAVPLAPDLVMEPANPRRPPLGDRRWAEHVNRHLQTGWHRDPGFCLPVRTRCHADESTPLDLRAIAPTIAALLDREAPPHLAFEPFAERADSASQAGLSATITRFIK